MVAYYHDRSPSIPFTAANAMNASVVLDQPGNVSFTNLDEISGRVVLRCNKSSTIDAILVKLEGESRTRLLSPTGPNGEKAKPQLEYHKVCLFDIVRAEVALISSRFCIRCRWHFLAQT